MGYDLFLEILLYIHIYIYIHTGYIQVFCAASKCLRVYHIVLVPIDRHEPLREPDILLCFVNLFVVPTGQDDGPLLSSGNGGANGSCFVLFCFDGEIRIRHIDTSCKSEKVISRICDYDYVYNVLRRFADRIFQKSWEYFSGKAKLNSLAVGNHCLRLLVFGR